jgi:hypothetical protein
MHPGPELNTEAACRLMDEVRRLRAVADRWYQLRRLILDERTSEALTELAEAAEAKAMRGEDELKRIAPRSTLPIVERLR